MKISEALYLGKKELLKSNLDIRVSLESEILLSFVLNKRREWLHAYSNADIKENKFLEFISLIKRRLNAEPIEYIIKEVSFYGYKFYVDNRVLIPRPETEILVDKSQEIIKRNHLKNIVEIGTGSGVISIILALLNPNIHIKAIDISQQALEVAKTNACFFMNNKISPNQIEFICADLFDESIKEVDFIISNPPYISNSFILEKNVLFEPHQALFGGNNGDEILKKIICIAKKKNVPFIACEIGFNQKNTLNEFLIQSSYKPEFYQDLSSIDRGFVAQLI